MPTNTTALANAANKAATSSKGDGLRGLLGNYMPAVKAALPAVMTPERFLRIAQSALSASPALQQSTPMSFLGAMMTAAQLGLEPNTPLGQAYIIPYKNKGQMEAQFQLGYRGLIALAYRSGQVNSIQAEVVYENDDFEYELGLEPKLKHRPAKSNRGQPILYYAVWNTKDGAKGFAVMSVDDIKAHAQRFSKAVANGRQSPWDSNFDEMAKKTVLKKALKYAPLASDFVRGMTSDNSIRDYTNGMDALDTASKTDEDGVVIDVEADAVEADKPNDAEQAAENNDR